MRVSDLVIDAYATMGQTLLLTDITPVFDYKNNHRTDEILGYKYHVAMTERRLEKVAVKIEGQKLLEISDDDYLEVEFQGLELSVYTMNGQTQVSARATGVSVVKGK